MRYFISLIALLFFYFFNVYGQPSITTVQGNIVNGELLIINGNGFGNNNLDFKWLGENIENGNAGDDFNAEGWHADQTSGGFSAPTYSTNNAHSGIKSIQTNYTVDKYGSGIGYVYNSEVTEWYGTFWIYPDLGNFQGQHKIFRLMGKEGYLDDNTVVYFNNWINGVKHAFLFPEDNTNIYWFSTIEDNMGPYEMDWLEHPLPRQWSRLEIYFKASSQGTKDGSVIYVVHTDGNISTTKISFSNNLMIYNGSKRFIAFYIQNYVGNGDRTGNEHIYIDDVFIQRGSRARIEIGDNADWAACSHREIQIPQSWSNNEIRFQFNQGSFAGNREVFLFVINANGTVSPGYSVVIEQSYVRPSKVTGVKVTP